MLIFDDTIQEKAWTDENELICWHYDHCSGRSVKGINLLNALYHCEGTSIPVAFELVKKPIQYCIIETKRETRKSEKTKNEMMREMIGTCLENALKFHFVLMDSWFSSIENFEFITGKGKHFIAALKDNRLIALSEEDRNNKRYVRVDALDFPEQTCVRGWLKGYSKEVLLVRQVFKNGHQRKVAHTFPQAALAMMRSTTGRRRRFRGRAGSGRTWQRCSNSGLSGARPKKRNAAVLPSQRVVTKL